MPAKSPFLSKTLWTNLIIAASALFIPAVGAWISAHPTETALVWAGINMILRFITKSGIAIE